MESQFHQAAENNDTETLARLLADGVDINGRVNLAEEGWTHLRGLTALMVAARSNSAGSLQTLRWLLDQGADLAAESECGNTAAWYAAGRGGRWNPDEYVAPTDQLERLRFLLDAGLDPQETDCVGRSLLTEACLAGDSARVMLLLSFGARAVPEFVPARARAMSDDLAENMRHYLAAEGVPQEFLARNVENLRPEPVRRLMSFQIPLYCAAESGLADCVRLILDAGANPDTRDDDNATPIMFAGSPDVVHALVRAGANVHAVDRFGKDALQILIDSEVDHVAADQRFAVAEALSDSGADINWRDGSEHTRLYNAAFARSAEGVRFLLKKGADIHARQADYSSPLHAVCWQGDSADSEANQATARIIDALIDAGIHVDVRDGINNTPLQEAADGDWGSITAVRCLLRRGAAVDAVNLDFCTPLMLAAGKGNRDCVSALLAGGAKASSQDRAGKNALVYAQETVQSWQRISRQPNDFGEVDGKDSAAARDHHDMALSEARACVELLRKVN